MSSQLDASQERGRVRTNHGPGPGSDPSPGQGPGQGQGPNQGKGQGPGQGPSPGDGPGITPTASWSEWWPVVLGLSALFGPTFYTLFTGAWIGEEQGHGPIIFSLALWLSWRKWPEVQAASSPPRLHPLGWPVLAFGLGIHLLGRSQNILMFEIGSIVAVLAAVVLLKLGARALRVLWFPFFFMLFMVPLPSELVAAVTMPMKMGVSWATEQLLFGFGYPVARAGVVLQIGQYQLLVADACAGLQTLLTLEALGLFYLNLMRHPSAFRNMALAILIVPVSFAANVIRVVALTLVTFHLGDAAGQGFLHGFAGMVLFVTALLMILALDSGLQWFIRRRQDEAGHGAGEAGPPRRGLADAMKRA